MLVKICGITRLEDARGGGRRWAPARSGSCSGRTARAFIDPYRARAIVARAAAVRHAGRRVREPAGRRTSTAWRAWCGLGAVQLHGDETPAFAAAIDAAGDQGRAARRSASRDSTRGRRRTMLLLDAHDPVQRGGTGRTIDWDARRGDRGARGRIVLAGGLTPDNVADAIARGAAVRHRRVVGRRVVAGRQGSRAAARAVRAPSRGRSMSA